MILWTIRLATLFYAIGLAQIIYRRDARLAWTAGWLCYVAHVAAAFQWAYGWSHAIAVRETARQTQELFGLDWGGGVWFNYAFTAVWTLDVVWWHLAPQNRNRRPGWVTVSIHSYLAWMFINGAIVFPKTPTRWAALSLAIGLVVARFWRKG